MLPSFLIPNSVTEVGDYAFYDSRSLRRVTIGSGVTSLGEGVFSQCRNLWNVTSVSTTPPEMLNEGCFPENAYNYGRLNVPASAIETYQTTDWWSRFPRFFPLLEYDVNGDGEVNIADVTSLIDGLLNPYDGSMIDACADVDGNGAVGISDVTALIDYQIGRAHV